MLDCYLCKVHNHQRNYLTDSQSRPPNPSVSRRNAGPTSIVYRLCLTIFSTCCKWFKSCPAISFTMWSTVSLPRSWCSP